jgi:uncharacterized LabA/DUF88 family protein
MFLKFLEIFMKKATVFVDANNWYHNVKLWFKPGDIDIIKVVKLISEEKEFDVVEIRWYASMPNRQDNELTYKRQRSFLGGLQKQGVKIITRKLQRLSNKEIKKKRQEFIESWDLCEKCKPIVEESFLDVADHHKKEKGIDVWIAVDMIRKSIIEKECDVCLLISGDADFIPSLELVKKQGKDVLSASVPSGYSSELRQKFPFLIIQKEDLAKCLKEYKK